MGGGGAVRAYELLSRLAERGHAITVLSGRYPGAGDYEEGLVSYRFAGSRSSYLLSTFSYALQSARFVKERGEDFDIIIEDFAPWNPVFSPVLTKKPAVLHVNHREGIGILRRWLLPGLPFYCIEALYPRLFSHVTALSEGTKKKLGREDAVIFPAGIGEGICASFGEAADEGYFIYVGRLHIKNKGLDTLFGAISETGMRLLLAGRGPDEQRLREMAERFTAASTEFAGFLSEEEKLRAISRSAALVLPSRFEGQGIVILEAAACGKPVIVSDIPELRYAVDAGFGLSFRTGDTHDLAGKIRLLAGDEGMRREMGRKAREYAGRFTWDRLAQEYEAFLKSVVENARNA